MNIDWRKFTQVAELIAPAILAATGCPPALIPFVQHGLALAQADPGKSGAEKKAFVLDSVATVAGAINASKPGTISETWPIVVGQGIDVAIAAVRAVHQLTPEGIVLPAAA